MAIKFDIHNQSLAELQMMFRQVEGRMRTEHGETRTKVTEKDVQDLGKYVADYKGETNARKLIDKFIQSDDKGNWIPWQPQVLEASPDGPRVTMPTTLRVGPGPGDIVALYAAMPDPIRQKAELLVKFDSMMLDAANSLEKALPHLLKLAETEVVANRTLTKQEVDGLLLVTDGIKAAMENIDHMMGYRQQLASELRAYARGEPVTAATTDSLVQNLLKQVNDLGNDYEYHSGWNPSAVLYHATTIAKDEAKDFVDAMKAAPMGVQQRRAALRIVYENAGDNFSPLIIDKTAAKTLTDYAKDVGVALDFSTVQNHQKHHPLG